MEEIGRMQLEAEYGKERLMESTELRCWEQEQRGSEEGAWSTSFENLPGVEHYESIFYIIYILIYFDAYIFKKNMQNVELVVQNMKT